MDSKTYNYLVDLQMLILKEEGQVTDKAGNHIPYLDKTGKPARGGKEGKITIGFGRNLERGVSEQIARAMLAEDMAWVIKELPPLVGDAPLSKNRRVALASLLFQQGTPSLRKKAKFLEAVKARNWQAAVEAIDKGPEFQILRRNIPKRLERIKKALLTDKL